MVYDITKYSAKSGQQIRENGEIFNIADSFGASMGQGVQDEITDTLRHTPSGDATHWQIIEALSDSVLAELAQDNLYLNGVTASDKAVLLGAVAASGTLTISNVATDAETFTIGTEVYEFAADEAQEVTGTNIAIDMIPYITPPVGTLTLTGVVSDEEVVNIGDETYEFDIDDTVTEGNILVDISGYMAKASQTLTIDTNPTATNTMTIGTTEYTFRATADFDAAGEIEIGTDAAATQANIVAAIMGTDGVNEAHELVTIGAFADNIATVTAKTAGTAGNSIATTETFTAGTNVFGDTALAGGTDTATAPNAILALVAAITANSEVATAVDGSGDTVVVTAVEKFPESPIASTVTMAHGGFGATTLAADTTCSAADAVTAIVAAINGNDDSLVTAADGAGNTVVATAKVRGTAGNSLATTDTMSNGVWGAETLEDGANSSTVTAGTVYYGQFTAAHCISGSIKGYA